MHEWWICYLHAWFRVASFRNSLKKDRERGNGILSREFHSRIHLWFCLHVSVCKLLSGVSKAGMWGSWCLANSVQYYLCYIAPYIFSSRSALYIFVIHIVKLDQNIRPTIDVYWCPYTLWLTAIIDLNVWTPTDIWVWPNIYHLLSKYLFNL